MRKLMTHHRISPVTWHSGPLLLAVISFLLLPFASSGFGLQIVRAYKSSKAFNCGNDTGLHAKSEEPHTLGCRRKLFVAVATATTASFLGTSLLPLEAWARSPGSTDLSEAIRQIADASDDLLKLQRNWDQYAVIDSEGRAVTDATVLARRILGGVAPLAGATAIEVAKNTPLYRIDGAFNAVRKAALSGDGGAAAAWVDNLDLPAFEELSERLQFELQKADGDLYSVQFASKGTKQISGIYREAKAQVDQGLIEIEAMKSLLRDAGAPGL